MANFSLTYRGVVISLIGVVFQLTGTPFVQADIGKFVDVGLQIVGAFVALYGRYRIGGVSALGMKR